MRFNGKVAVISGAASGIGRATALRLATEGASVALLDCKEEALADAADAIRQAGGKALPRLVDVTNPEGAKQATESVRSELGAIDILGNSAGAGWSRSVPFHDVSAGSWEWILDTAVP